MEHTLTPWGYTYDGSSNWTIGPVGDPQSNPVMNVWSRDDGKAVANVQFIVTACNAYEKDQEIIGELLEDLKKMHNVAHGFECPCQSFKNSLAKAESR